MGEKEIGRSAVKRPCLPLPHTQREELLAQELVRGHHGWTRCPPSSGHTWLVRVELVLCKEPLLLDLGCKVPQ